MIRRHGSAKAVTEAQKCNKDDRLRQALSGLIKSIAGKDALKGGKGIEPHIPIQSLAGFVLNKLQIEIRVVGPLVRF
jgi:hypothetical protein